MTSYHAKKNYYQYVWWIVVLIWVAFHIPFLKADPFVSLSPNSRDAFTDEGLNTSQIRNWVNWGDLNVWECDNLIKTPLFNALLALPFKIFGTYWLTARLTVLLCAAMFLFFAGYIQTMRNILPVFILIVFTQFHVFQYAHFSMSEMLAITSNIVAIAAWVNYAIHYSSYKRRVWLLISLVFVSFSWWFKIQFIYLILLIPISTLCLLFFKSYRENFKSILFDILMIVFFILITVGIYFVLWYLPNREAWNYLMDNQTSSRFPLWEYQDDVIQFNFNLHFNQRAVLPLFITFLTSTPIAIYLLIRYKSVYFQSFLIISFIWILLEVHKIFIHHVPGRYLVSTFVSIGLFATLVWLVFFYYLLQTSLLNKSNVWRIVGISLSAVWFLIITFFHFEHYFQTLQKRTYVINDVSNYLKQNVTQKPISIGGWGPSLTWGTQIKTLPVWNNFLNYKNLLESYRPRLVFSEPEEQDSNGALTAEGIILTELADSIKTYTVGKWPVNIFWINPQKMEEKIQQQEPLHEKI